MKKVLTVGAVLLLATAALFAAAPKTEGATEKNMFGMGANLGTDLGFYINYGYGIFDLDGVFGVNFIHDNDLIAEVGVNFALFDIAKACDFPGSMPITVGAAGALLIHFDPFDLGLKVTAPIKLAYTFEDVPVSLFFRLALGVGFDHFVTGGNNHVFFAWDISVGATYNFNF